ncbi:MAG: peptidoglycan-binding protein, partial [Chromatiaceae bacterium]|nr:peptidoglycan-binding protein [Chromatiaceae bacterium]
MTRAEVLALQAELTAQGFGPLTPDGQYGPATAAAYRAYLDALDPRTPSLIPPPERPWWAKPALLGGAASVLVALAGLAGWSLDAQVLSEVLSALASLVAGVLALYAGARGEAPLDKSQLAPGLRHYRLG